MAGSALLVIDTATSRTTLAVRTAQRTMATASSGPERGAASLGTRLSALLAEVGIGPAALAAVGVGTGPGSFTGLRVGLATAKTLAWSLGIPLVGIPTDDALCRAAAAATGADASMLVVVQPAGARDHYLSLPGQPPRLVPPGEDLAGATGGHPVVAVDADPARLAGCVGPAAVTPVEAGVTALVGLGAAMLSLLEERLTAGMTDDPATLVPVYVALPRGIAAAAGVTWTPELR